MAELRTALLDARVGQQADCYVDPPDIPLEWYFELHWFGAGERTNSFKVTQDPSVGPDCPLAIQDLLSAIAVVENSARQSPTTSLATPR